MKKLPLILGAVLLMLLPACKRQNWTDWRLENQLWIENESKKPGVITTPTGLRYKCVSQPSTEKKYPDDLKTVRVKYSGRLITGNEFGRNSNDNGDAMAVSDMISGFAEGIKKMTVGAHYILYIPSDLAYGEDGAGSEGGSGYVPPYSTLIFDITLEQIY